jgi:sarcosine oxidase subunit beta
MEVLQGATDVTVIGGGVIGCSVALHLRRLGATVRILERDRLGGGSAMRGFGLIWVQTKAPHVYHALSFASARAYPEFLASLGDDCGYRRSGGMILIGSEQQAERLRELFADRRATGGAEATILSIRDARELEPAISPDLAGATYCAEDAQIEPRRLMTALMAATRGAGVLVEEGVAVLGQERRDAGWVLRTSSGERRSAQVVNCAGVWARDVARMIGSDLPLEPVRGQILTTAPRPPLLRQATLDVRQDADGRVWMGTINQPGRTSLAVDDEDSRTIREMTARQIPALGDLPVEGSWACVRAIPADGMPILGRVPGRTGQFVAVCHSGVTLCPIVGRHMAALIASGSAAALEPFRLDRDFGTAGLSFDLRDIRETSAATN